ncbi:putative RNA methyltransferase [Nocardia sp. NPDC101769]|uniref:putative RNA methyltransferase n=1 Tax=Nocardia sp. NPDC101769 TaxID=3364333 RepID=UPI00381D6041
MNNSSYPPIVGTAEPSPAERLLACADLLACPQCGRPLAAPVVGDPAARALRCPHGHSFDLAKQGYVSLLTGASTKMTGDTPAMLDARTAFQAAGHFAPIAAALAETVAAAIPHRDAEPAITTPRPVTDFDTAVFGADSPAAATSRAHPPAPHRHGDPAHPASSHNPGQPGPATPPRHPRLRSGTIAPGMSVTSASAARLATTLLSAGVAPAPKSTGGAASSPAPGAQWPTDDADHEVAALSPAPGGQWHRGDTGHGLAAGGQPAESTSRTKAHAAPRESAVDRPATAAENPLAGPNSAVREGTTSGAALLEIGAGTGYYLTAVLDAVPGARGVALDVSKAAARRAARAHARGGSVLADAWRGLPVRDGVMGAVVSVFAPRNADEVARVLAEDGRFVVVTPTSRHLGELIEPLGMVSVDAAKADRLAESLGERFELVGHDAVEYTMELSHEDVANVAAMGPSAFHAAERRAEQIAALPDPMLVTASVTISVYRPR